MEVVDRLEQRRENGNETEARDNSGGTGTHSDGGANVKNI